VPFSPQGSSADDLRDRLDTLEAERLVLTIELRNALIRAAKDLLPRAIAQAKGTPAGEGKPARPVSPALLRLITRLAMRPTQIDKTPPR
jgi:hypothetical protein